MSYHRPLFYSAAAFNIGASLPFLLAADRVGPAMGLALTPVADTLLQLICLMVAIFGGAYALIACDPMRYRPYIPLGAILKLAVVATIWTHGLAGDIGMGLPLLTLVDLTYAVLFLHYWKRTASAVAN